MKRLFESLTFWFVLTGLGFIVMAIAKIIGFDLSSYTKDWLACTAGATLTFYVFS